MNKKMKTINSILAVTMLVIGICTLIVGITGVIGVDLPVAARRVIGVLEIISGPLMVYTSVMKFMEMTKAAGNVVKKGGKLTGKKAAEDPSVKTNSKGHRKKAKNHQAKK